MRWTDRNHSFYPFNGVHLLHFIYGYPGMDIHAENRRMEGIEIAEPIYGMSEMDIIERRERVIHIRASHGLMDARNHRFDVNFNYCFGFCFLYTCVFELMLTRSTTQAVSLSKGNVNIGIDVDSMGLRRTILRLIDTLCKQNDFMNTSR
jgi:hypothetical protein